MNFTEFGFWPRLLACLTIVWFVRLFIPKKREIGSLYDRVALGVVSLYLLSCVGHLTFVIFLSVFLTAWCLIIIMFHLPPEKRKYVLAIGIPLLCAPLFYYKYRIFILKDVLRWEHMHFATIAIPAGISFYTFQKVAMLVDASRMQRWEPKFIDYLNFATFFPQVVAGPIERKSSLFPQMEKFSFQWSWLHFHNGAPWLALGLFYKLCLADNLSPFINREAMDSAWPIALSTFLFGLKIYFDFCGYSMIALGLAKCLGIEITLNFRSPYWSGNIREFWRRWHISLSYWFRDYIYIPLGGSQNNRWAVNLFIVFALSGIWHGAGWGFVIWGSMHGVFSIISHFLKDKFRLPWIVGWPITLGCVFLSWLPFYETRLNVLITKLSMLVTPSAWSLPSLGHFIGTYEGGDLITLLASILFALSALAFEGLTRLRKNDDYAHAFHPFTIAVCMAGVILLGTSDANEFVYFAF